MNPMSPQEENRFVGEIERAIQLTHEGLSPNDAITKIASESKYGPEHIQRIAQAFNKSKSVYKLKTASAEDRAESFDLADAREIIQKVYSEKEATVSEIILPQTDFSKIFLAPTIEKTASATSFDDSGRNLGIHRFSAASTVRNYQDVVQGIQDKLASKAAEARYNFNKSLDEVADHVVRMPEAKMRKVAQAVVNSYPGSGQKLLKVIESKMNRPIPEVQKTASAAVFKTQEPYLSITKVYAHAEKIAKATQDIKAFHKQAEGFGGSFIANAAANILADKVDKPDEKVKPLADTLDPEAYNNLKEIETQRMFMNLALYDKDLQNYGYQELVDAYNNSVSTVPDASKNSAVLKNLMLTNLQSSGLKDKFELQQELNLQKSLEPKSEPPKKI